MTITTLMMGCARGCTLDQLLEQPLIADVWRGVEAGLKGVPQTRQLRELVRTQIGLMVGDVISATRGAARDAGVANVADVRALGRALGGFSPEMVAAERGLKRFMYRTLYHHPSQMAAADAARDVVSSLFTAYQGDPGTMGGSWSAALPDDEVGRARHIADYIAGMTDRFALDRFAELFGKEAVPEALNKG